MSIRLRQRVALFGVGALVAVTALLSAPPHASAGMSIDQFVAATQGKEWANQAGGDRGECVSLVSQYLLMSYGIVAGAWGNAVDYRAGGTGGNRLSANGFTWSTDRNFANGDILVWTGPTAFALTAYGHIAIWYDGRIYDQNNAGRRSAGFGRFNGDGFLGYWRKGTGPPEPNVVSPGDPGFTRGPEAGWYPVAGGGVSGRAIYTFVNNRGRENWGRWTFDLTALSGSGTYSIDAHIPNRDAGSTSAKYRVSTRSGMAEAVVNQRATTGWTNLGTFEMASGSAWVELDDFTGEPWANDENHHLAFDSLRVTFVAPFTHTISASAGAHGAIAPSGPVTVTAGASQTFAFTPDEGYQVSEIVVDGVAAPTASAYTFDSVTSDRSISVTFSPIVLATTLSVSAPSAADVGGAVRVTGTLTPAPPEGEVHVTWQRRAGNKNVSIKSVRAALVKGSFAVSRRIDTRGRWEVVVSFPGSGEAPRYLPTDPVVKVIRVK